MGKTKNKISLKDKVHNFINVLPKWKTPSEGMSLTLKEWLMYIVGCMGCYATIVIMNFVSLQQGLYIAAACNINVDHVALIGVISSVFTIFTTPLISWLLDNTNTKIGKFRPYLLFLPLPMTACFFAIGQVIKIDNYTTMLIVFAILSNVLNFFIRIYNAAYTSIPQVVSPNPDERTQLMSIGLMLSSCGPTLVNILFPVLANAFYSTDGNGSDGVNQIGAYEWVLPLLALAFMLIGICLAAGVKERTVVAKNFKQKQSFLQGCKKTFSNKFFWILNVSNFLGILKMVMSTLLLWYVIYDVAPALTEQGWGKLASSAQSVIQTVIGGACVPGMLLTPWVIKKIGKKKLLLIVNFGMAAVALPMLFISNAWVHILCIFAMNIFNGFQIVALPACQAEMNDFQQYKTGDRIEGFLNQFSAMFYTAISLGTAFIAPAVYKHFGYVDNTDVLYNHDILFNITRTMAAIGLVSAILSALPFFFWNMTESKHKTIMEILKVRASRADGDMDDDTAQRLENEISSGNISAYSDYCEERKSDQNEDNEEIAQEENSSQENSVQE